MESNNLFRKGLKISGWKIAGPTKTTKISKIKVLIDMMCTIKNLQQESNYRLTDAFANPNFSYRDHPKFILESKIRIVSIDYYLALTRVLRTEPI